MRRTGKAARPYPGPRMSAQCARNTRPPAMPLRAGRSRRIISQTGSLPFGVSVLQGTRRPAARELVRVRRGFGL